MRPPQQDVIEHHFAHQRQKGGSNQNPRAMELLQGVNTALGVRKHDDEK